MCDDHLHDDHRLDDASDHRSAAGQARTGLSRRGFFGAAGAVGASAAFLGGLALPAGTTPARAADQPTAAGAAPNAISPEEALQRLMDGNARYVANKAENCDYSHGRDVRAGVQYPIVGLVSCSDSRLAPEIAFDQGPGEVFVVRVAGNFVNEDGLASLEYGVAVLGMPLIMVLGHSGCGAVDATIKAVNDGTQFPGHLPRLVDAIRPAVEIAKKASPENLLAAATVENVRYNMQRLTAATPIVAEAAAAGKVKIVGGIYDIATGVVTLVT